MTEKQTIQKSFILDLNKCTGCGACRLACAIENDVELQNSWRSVYTFNEFNFPQIPKYHFSLACNHCIDPPCLKYCPALAYTKDKKTGAVRLDQTKCIGCKYCSWVCPYDAPKFNQNRGVMEKCTFCEHRLKEGFDPACVALCPTTALQFGDYQENNSTENLAGFTQSLIKPAIQFTAKKNIPESSLQTEIDKEDILTSFKNPNPKIVLSKEWNLLVFTLLAALLVGWYSTVMLNREINLSLLPGIGILTLLISLFHLGKVFRAHRAVLNVKNSWLSREILFFALFLVLIFLNEYLFHSSQLIKWLTIVAGFLALFSIDRVYTATASKSFNFHSAQTIFTGVLFFGFLSNNEIFFIVSLIIKMLLYVVRKFKKQEPRKRPVLTLSRILFGFIFALVFGTSALPGLQIFGFLCLLLGEIIDRCEFYSELKIPTPQSQINEDLFKAIRQKKTNM